MSRDNEKDSRRLRRKKSIRVNISGTADVPRMTVFRSNKHMYVQVIDDTVGKTLASASNLEKETLALRNNVQNAEKIGELIGERLKAKNIQKVVFDRNGYKYHGIVKAIADGARKTGIQF
ncbi:MAG TPA: 50S ribosomal protein L18 [Spirochaetia bacterium]|jgi:large subunit ribosomal protein L18|nr:50S ribosomal protein L18 [Spirochaetia bacterium]